MLPVIGEEAGRNKTGGDLMAFKMSETIFGHAIRSFIDGQCSLEWELGAVSHKNLSRTLGAFHKAPADP